jgi:hypothetical protein
MNPGRRMRIVGAAVFAAVAVSCAKQPPAPEIPLLEAGLWTFEIETRREGKPTETRTIRDCVGLRGLYSADRPTQCRRNEAVRSSDGRQLTVHISCEVEPRRIEDVLPGEARGRGPLDFREPGMKVESRSVFSGDLRKQYVRDNVTTVEWPLGEAVTTRSVTRGVWQASACPADLPPDVLERWLLIPRGAGGSEPRPEDPPELQIDRDLAPKMLKGLWSSTVRTRVDGGTEEIHPEEICVTDDEEVGDAIVMPSAPTFWRVSLCEGSGEVTGSKTPRGFRTLTRCDLPEGHLMTADLDFMRPSMKIESTSDYSGDFGSRFEVGHDTRVIYGSGRKSRIASRIELARLDDCAGSGASVSRAPKR